MFELGVARSGKMYTGGQKFFLKNIPHISCVVPSVDFKSAKTICKLSLRLHVCGTSAKGDMLRRQLDAYYIPINYREAPQGQDYFSGMMIDLKTKDRGF